MILRELEGPISISAKIQVRKCSARLETNNLLTVDFTLEYWKRINIGFQNPTEDWDNRGGGGLIMPVEIGHQELRWPV